MNALLDAAWKVGGLSPVEKLVLLRLADRADATGRCFPGQTSIAKECGCTTRAVRDAVRTLEEKRCLTVEVAPTFSTSARYRVTLPPPEPTSGGEQGSGEEQGSLPSGTVFPPLRNSVPPNPQEPPLNPQTSGGAVGNGFDEFWEAYPRKVSKAAALKAWRKVKPDELPAIMAALVAQKRSEDWIKDRGRYIPHPATWLNNRRWEDESTPADEIERLAEELRAHPGNPYAAAYHADLVTPEQTADFKTKRERYNKLTEATR